ncbi:MAG TPA: PorV/PorQ family protein [Bacteroidetes bacterium]|nr:PorV/PorQ family protein [Bacteroidota bacterium]HDZ11272.1 PorV/PorQ family protein [Bacteroidota bacterium]
MMKAMKIIIISLILTLVAASFSEASLRKPGINGAAFLKIGVGSRMVALGSAVTTISGDPNTIFWNPAGIVIDAGKTQVGVNYNNWLIGMKHTAGVVTHSFGDLGTVGVGFIHIGLSNILADRDIAPPGYKQYQIDQATSATYNYSDIALMASYAKAVTDHFNMGMTVKYIREHIDNKAASSVAFDFGVIYKTGFRDLKIGARMSNLGNDLTFFAMHAPIPLSFAIGTSMSLAKEENTQVKAFFDFVKPQDNPQLYFLGAEWNLYNRLVARGGYKFNYSGVTDKEGTYQTAEGFSFGLGLNVPVAGYELWFDYAFTNFDLFNNTNRFTLKFEF